MALTLKQRETLDLIATGKVRMTNAGYGAYRISGAIPAVVGKLISLQFARRPKGPIGEQTCELTDAGRAARIEGQ